MRRRMDDPVPMPALLAHRPDMSESSSDASRIHFFDGSTQSVPRYPEFAGVRLYRDFLSESEASGLLEAIGKSPFSPAQSGKAKQHYGPRINFNKRKMNPTAFVGLPAYARELESRMRTCVRDDPAFLPHTRASIDAALEAFETTDVFVLRYWPEEESNLDFHLDDPFAYGELILDISLESDAILTFVRGRPNSELGKSDSILDEPVCVRVPMPARSLVVLYGPARFEWEHAILTYDIEFQRTSVTLRTLSQALRKTDDGRIVVERARGKRV